MALSLIFSVLFLVSTFSNARISFSTTFLKRSTNDLCTPGSSRGVYAGLLGGVFGGRGEVGGFGITSVYAIVLEMAIFLRTKV